jgi:Fur family ferric uptake transcriptional regulator
MSIPESLIDRLQAEGERLTIQRRMVIEAMCSIGNHATLQEIQSHIAASNPGQALPDPTVYRILQWLKDLAIISQTDMGNAGVVYELIDTPPHHHLICLNCGGSIQIDDALFADLRDRLRREFGFEPRIDHMAIYGLCHDCEEQQKD